MSSDPYVNLYTSDFLAGTSGMTAATKGVYITLLCLMYEGEAPLAQSWATLARRCGCTLPAFNRAVSELQDDGKVTVSDAGIWSEKCDKHIARRRERQSSAKAAAEKRWGKTQQKQGKADANAMREACQPEPEPYIREDTDVSSRRKPSPLEGFDAFWGIWPSKTNKDAARKAWRKLSIDSRRMAYRAVRDGWFDRWQQAHPDANPIHASRFLNGKRWEDQIEPEDNHGNRNRHKPNRPSPHSTLFAAARSLAGHDDGGGAGTLGSMRDVTPPGGEGLDDGEGGDTAQSFLRVIDGRG